jgi:hypothetical protein
MSIYHLHIPRTSGGFTRNLLVNSENFKNHVAGHYRTISEYDFQNADFVSGHYGINPINFVDKTFTIIRDPNELTFSYIKYLSMVPGGELFNEDHMKRYLNEEDLRGSVTNVMSKFLSLEVDLEKYNSNIHDHMNMAKNSWYLKSETYSADIAIENIDRNNISVFLYESETLHQDILKMLEIEERDQPRTRTNISFVDNSGFYEKYFKDIYEANDQDIILYKRLA